MSSSRLDDPQSISIQLLQDQHGRHIYKVVKGVKAAYVRRSEIAAAASPSSALAPKLASQGVNVLSTAQRHDIVNRMDQIVEVTGTVTVAESSGWVTPQTFVFQDGVAYTNGMIDSAIVVIFEGQLKSTTCGSLWAWKAGMACLSSQNLLQSVVCIGLTPIILRHYGKLANVSNNFGVELTGHTSTGKTTALRAAGSLWGGREDSNLGWAETWLSTDNGIETLMHQHADALLVLDEANLAGTGHRARGAKQRAAVFMLSSGRGRARHGDKGSERSASLITLSSSNEPLSSNVSKEGIVAPALGVRMSTIDLTGRPHGVLNHPGAAGAAAVMEALNTAIRDNYGHGAREFARRLTSDIVSDDVQLKRCVQNYIETFRKKAVYESLPPPAQRVCNTFALVYAAGRLGLRYNVLPAEWTHIGTAVLTTFQNAIRGVNFESRIEIDQFETKLGTLKEKVMNLLLNSDLAEPCDRDVVGYVKMNKSDQAELLVRPDMFKIHFTANIKILRVLRNRKLLVCDGPHLTTWRKLSPSHKNERFHVIRIDVAAASRDRLQLSRLAPTMLSPVGMSLRSNG